MWSSPDALASHAPRGRGGCHRRDQHKGCNQNAHHPPPRNFRPALPYPTGSPPPRDSAKAPARPAYLAADAENSSCRRRTLLFEPCKIFADRLRGTLDIKVEWHALPRRALGRAEIFGHRRQNFFPRLPLRVARNHHKRTLEAGARIARAGALAAATPLCASPPQGEGLAIALPM